MNREKTLALATFWVFLAPMLSLAAQQAPVTPMAGTKLHAQCTSEVGTSIWPVNDGVEVRLIKPVEAEPGRLLPARTILSELMLPSANGRRHRKRHWPWSIDLGSFGMGGRGHAYRYDCGGHRLHVYSPSPTRAEVEAVRAGECEFALAVEGPIIFLI